MTSQRVYQNIPLVDISIETFMRFQLNLRLICHNFHTEADHSSQRYF